jgi:hypothetical protein
MKNLALFLGVVFFVTWIVAMLAFTVGKIIHFLLVLSFICFVVRWRSSGKS